MGRDIKVSEVDLGEKANVTITLKDLDESYYDPYRKTVSKFTLFMICKEQQEELATLRAENARLREHMQEINAIVDECEYDKKTRKTVDRLRNIAKEALK